MKLTKKNSLFITFLLLTTSYQINGMEPKPKKKKQSVRRRIQSWVSDTGSLLLGNTEKLPMEPFLFAHLPHDVINNIIDWCIEYADAQSAAIAAKAIISLSGVNKELNNLMNNTPFCLQLI